MKVVTGLPEWVIIAALLLSWVWYSSAAFERLETLEANLATLTVQVADNRQYLDAKLDKLDAKIDAKFDMLFSVLLERQNAARPSLADAPEDHICL